MTVLVIVSAVLMRESSRRRLQDASSPGTVALNNAAIYDIAFP